MTPAAFQLSADFDLIIAGMADIPAAAERGLDQLRHGWDYSVFGEPEPVNEVRELRIPVGDAAICARLYRPHGTTSALLVYYHGGGWVMGDLESHDRVLRHLANEAGVVVLAVDYRLAPEHRFPTAFEDGVAALEWARDKRDELGCAGKALLVGGDSAGGNLAATVALASRGKTPLAGQLLLYPSLDGRCASVSYAEMNECKLLTSKDMRWYWDQYAPTLAERTDWRASPCLAQSLVGSAPTIIVIAGVDPLRDEGLDYANALAKGGTRVTLLHYPELPHGFFNFYALAPAAARAMTDITAQLRLMSGISPK